MSRAKFSAARTAQHNEFIAYLKKRRLPHLVPKACYTYRNELGEVAFQKLRCSNKKTGEKIFLAFHRGPNGALVMREPKFPETGKPLFALPQLIATPPLEPVYFVEGEKCAIALLRLGLSATTSGGASSAEGTDLRPLYKRNVVLWADNDIPGHELMDAISEALVGHGCSVSRIDVRRLGLAEKGDCVDWLKANPTSGAAQVNKLVRVAVMRDRVRARPRSIAELFPSPRLADGPVDGGRLLRDLRNTVRRFVICTRAEATAAALWIVHTWLFECFDVSPLLHISAAEKQSGESICLSVIGKLTRKAVQLSNLSSASMFRIIEAYEPTLLVDETDTSLVRSEDFRGILNSGHHRAGARVVRCATETLEPVTFSTFCPKVLCGIGSIPETLADRSIPVRLKRKLPTERVDRFDDEPQNTWDELAGRCARFAQDNVTSMRSTGVRPIRCLSDRTNDSWRPLLAIATVIGDPWLARARKAAIKLHVEPTPSIGTELLVAIRRVFTSTKVTRIHTSDLLEALKSEEEDPWNDYRSGRPIAGHDLSKLLSQFGIRSQQLRIGSENKKGYSLRSFADAFARYVK